jgi:hypothetical protein
VSLETVVTVSASAVADRAEGVAVLEVVVVFADNVDDSEKNTADDEVSLPDVAVDDGKDDDNDAGASATQTHTSSFGLHYHNCFQPLQHFQLNVRPNGTYKE